VALIIVAGGAVVLLAGGDEGETLAEVDGIECQRNEQLNFHIHSTVLIYIDGEQMPVPANVGVRPNECLFWLHTHDGTGLIHVEAPEKRDFTLGQFFAVWGQPLSSTQLLDQTADATHEITVTINGEPYEGNPADIVFADLDTIVLQYGES
jgi:hypothetical protein